MSFSVTGAHICVVLFHFVYPFVWQGLMAGLWILLVTWVVPSCRGWVAGPREGCFGNLYPTCDEFCLWPLNFILISLSWELFTSQRLVFFNEEQIIIIIIIIIINFIYRG